MNRKNRVFLSEEVCSVANLPKNKEYDIKEFKESKLTKNIIDYYEEDVNSIDTVKYEVKTDSDTTEIRSLLGTLEESDGYCDFDSIRTENAKIVERSPNALEKLNVSGGASWNGESCYISYDDGDISVGKSDWYTTSIMENALYWEIHNAINQDGKNDYPLRRNCLSEREHFTNPVRPIQPSVGGALIANTKEGWMLILGRRSKLTSMMRDKLSIIPFGMTEYSDIEDGGFEVTARREFKEELFNDSYAGDVFYEKYIDSSLVCSGWKLREGAFVVGYMLIIDQPMYHEILEDSQNINEEYTELVKVPIKNKNEIVKNVNTDEMSGAAIPIVLESLSQIDKDEELPDLPYDVNRLF